MAHVKVVGFSGKMGSGKTTSALLSAHYLQSLTGECWHVVAFANSLKRLVASIYNIPLALCFSDVGKSTVPYLPIPCRPFMPADFPFEVPRDRLVAVERILIMEGSHKNTVGRLLQIVGDAFRKEVDPDFWIKILECEMFLAPGANFIIEDVRYPNEFDWIVHVKMGIVGRIVSGARWTNTNTGRDDSHISETALDACTAWHFQIENDEDDIALMSSIAKEFSCFF